MIPFTLLCNGIEKSLADWGIDDLEYEWDNLAPHYLTFTIGGRAIDAASIFPYGATVEVWQGRSAIGQGGTRWFYGRVEPWELAGVGGESPSENQMGRLVNPWWHLAHLVYQMEYISNSGVLYSTPRVVLNVAYDPVTTHWKYLTTGQQIAAALQWAIDQGAPIKIGNIAPWASPASDFQKGITCAEVIQKMWRIESDFVVVWDYSTLPYPTIHCLKGSAAQLDPSLSPAQQAPLLLAPKNIDLNAANWLEKVRIKPRPDWQKSYVRIFYDQVNAINQSQFLAITIDQWPNPLPADTESKFRGLDLFFDLSGSRISQTLEEEIITTAPFDITSLAQWQRWKPDLAADTIQSVVILNSFTAPPADANHSVPAIQCTDNDANGNAVAYNYACAFELLDGMYHDWMLFPGQKVRATAWAQITHKNGTVEFRQLTADFTAVALNTLYTPYTAWTETQTIQAYAENAPQGVAKAIYTAWQALAVEGQLTSIEQELTGAIGFGNCLNFISPQQPAWATLNAVVQSISGSALHGTTNVRFGAPLHLTAAQLVDLMRISRFRFPSLNLAYLFGGALSDGGGTVRHPRKSHTRAAQAGAVHKQKLVVSPSPNPAGETSPANQITIDLDPGDIKTIYNL